MQYEYKIVSLFMIIWIIAYLIVSKIIILDLTIYTSMYKPGIRTWDASSHQAKTQQGMDLTLLPKKVSAVEFFSQERWN